MKPELTEKLYQKYPAIFANRCGFAHGDGWYGIIDFMCEAMTYTYTNFLTIDEARGMQWGIEPHKTRADDKPVYVMEMQTPQVVADQVKQKLGTLRFYYHLELESRLRELAYGENPLPEAIRMLEKYESLISGIVHMAYTLSAGTCEATGKKGCMHVTEFGWRRTLNREFAKTDKLCKSDNYVPLSEASEQP